jgi:hypothetical protein
MIKEKWVEVEYLHKLTEDIEEYIYSGLTVLRTSDSKKRERYSVFDGDKFRTIPPEKIKVYQLTTKHSVEELPVE